MEFPERNSLWYSSNPHVLYRVLFITNTSHVNPDYPFAVVYENMKNDTKWSCTPERFLEKMTEVGK